MASDGSAPDEHVRLSRRKSVQFKSPALLAKLGTMAAINAFANVSFISAS